MSMRFSFDGTEQLKKALDPLKMINDVKKIVRLNGSELQRKAVRLAPYKTGTLKRSIQLRVKNGGTTAEVEATAEYAPYLEYGTRFMEAKPYMKPAFNEQSVKFKHDLDRLTSRR